MEKQKISNLIPACLLNSHIHSVVITDLEGKYIFVNQVFQKRFAFITHDFIGTAFQNTIHPEDIDKCNLAAYTCITNPSAVVPVQVRKPDNLNGDYYWTNWEFSLFEDEHKTPIGLLCIGQDVTEAERAYEKIQKLAQQTNEIIEHINDGFYMLNHQWEFIKINRVAAEIFNTHQEQVMGKVIWDLLPDTDEYKYPSQLRRAMEQYITVAFEDDFLQSDRWFQVIAYPCVEGLTVVFRELTEQKRIEDELKRTNVKLKALYESTKEANTLIDKNLKILYINQVAKSICQDIFGKMPQIGDDVLDFMLPDLRDEFRIYYLEVLKGSSFRIEKSDGKKWWLFSLSPVYDDLKNLIGIADNLQDITEQKNDELRITAQNKRLTDIAWTQSHEVRRPVANILGLCGLIKEDIDAPKDDMLVYVNYLNQAADELDEIIHKVVAQTNEVF
jgi:PAS domain S-box-containing protein